MPFSDQPPGATVQPCPLASPAPVYWVEIELIGEDDSPIPWEAYELRLPDGQCVPGFLDDQGFARFDNLASAQPCEVRFPNLDKDAWEKLETRAAKASS
ncbi:hypothetical protein ACIP1T_28080 [Pseudomonas japonica]|uniref:hypothetical protein n=1 Tax=Pseudomonas japonica TaxID=256466 RepID=UPI0037FE23F4